MIVKLEFRRGSSSEWAAANPVLASGEPGYDVTLNRFKIGDGVTAWATLGYQTYDLDALNTAMAHIDAVAASIVAGGGTYTPPPTNTGIIPDSIDLGMFLQVSDTAASLFTPDTVDVGFFTSTPGLDPPLSQDPSDPGFFISA